MDEALLTCSICRTLVEEDDLFCPNCGAEAPPAPVSRGGQAEIPSAPGSGSALVLPHQFTCEGCGASMSFDPAVQSLRCPYCGSTKLEAEGPRKILKPEKLIPFEITSQEVEQRLRRYLSGTPFRPNDLLSEGTLVSARAVFVPCWVFSANTHTYWTADTDVLPPGSRGKWRPLFGEHQGRYDGMLIPASRVLQKEELQSIGSFDLRRAQDVRAEMLERFFVEVFTVPRKYARQWAIEEIRRQEAEACRQLYLSGRIRNLRTNVRITHLTGRPILLPVWVLAYRYRGKLYRFVVNGQTGQVAGEVPISWLKVAAVVLVIFSVLVLLAMLAFRIL